MSIDLNKAFYLTPQTLCSVKAVCAFGSFLARTVFLDPAHGPRGSCCWLHTLHHIARLHEALQESSCYRFLFCSFIFGLMTLNSDHRSTLISDEKLLKDRNQRYRYYTGRNGREWLSWKCLEWKFKKKISGWNLLNLNLIWSNVRKQFSPCQHLGRWRLHVIFFFFSFHTS